MGRNRRRTDMEKQNNKVRNLAIWYMDEILDGTLLEDILENAHTDLYHTGDNNKDTAEMLERVLHADKHQRKNAQSVFCDSRETIQNLLLDNIGVVAKWIQKNPDSYSRITIIDRPDDNEPTGIGVRYQNNKLQECYAYETTIVLERANNKYGFTCVTAYPNIMRQSAQPTKRDIQSELKQTKAYKHAAKTQQKKWEQAVRNGINLILTNDDLKFTNPAIERT